VDDRGQVDNTFHAHHLLAQSVKVGDITGAICCTLNGDAPLAAYDPYLVAVSNESDDGRAANGSCTTGYENIHRSSIVSWHVEYEV
jgi:hypothetical protein